jgi:hypothetical protein
MNRPPEHWIETLRNLALEPGFDTFVCWPEEEPLVHMNASRRGFLCASPSLPESAVTRGFLA